MCEISDCGSAVSFSDDSGSGGEDSSSFSGEEMWDSDSDDEHSIDGSLHQQARGILLGISVFLNLSNLLSVFQKELYQHC